MAAYDRLVPQAIVEKFPTERDSYGVSRGIHRASQSQKLKNGIFQPSKCSKFKSVKKNVIASMLLRARVLPQILEIIEIVLVLEHALFAQTDGYI